MPAMVLWSRSTPLSWARPAALEDARGARRGEVVGQRVGSEAGDARARRAGRGRRTPRGSCWVPGLGEVEAGAVVEHDPRGQRRLAAGPGRHRRHLVAPAHPAGPGQVEDQVQAASRRCRGTCRAGVTPSTSVPSSADSGGSKVFRALNAAMSTRTIARPSRRAAQVLAQGFHLGQLGHAVTLVTPTPTHPSIPPRRAVRSCVPKCRFLRAEE